MKQNKIFKAVALLMVFTVLSRGIGFIRDILIAKQYGATFATDAYNIAVSVPEMIFGILGLAISTTFIPILSDIYINESKENMFKFVNNVNSILITISLLLYLFGFIFTKGLIKIMVPNFSGDVLELTVKLTRISLINIIFLSINASYTAVLQVMDDFIVPSLLGIVFNIPIIFYILFSSTRSIEGLTIATTIGNALRVAIQFPSLRKHGYKLKFFLDFSDNRVLRMLNLIIPVMIGAGVNQINLIIDKALASGFDFGSISALNYSSRLIVFVNGALGSSLITVTYPLLAKKISEKNFIEFKVYLIKTVMYMLLLLAPFTVVLLSLNKEITTILFKRGAFDEKAVIMTSMALFYYSFSIPFQGVRDILNSALFSLQKTKTTTLNGILGMIINIGMSIFLSRFMGIGGIALAASLAAAVTCMLLIRSIRNSVREIRISDFTYGFIKVLFPSIISFIVIVGLEKLFTTYARGAGTFVTTLICCFAGFLFYIITLIILRVQEFNELVNLIKAKVFKR